VAPARGAVVGLGLSVLDELYVLERLDVSAPRQRYRERVVGAGGMVANALCQAVALGARARLLTAHGDDAEGRRVRRELRAAGVDVRRAVRTDALPTTVAVVLVRRRDGERRFLVPDRRALEGRAPAFDVSCIDARSVLLVDGHFGREALRAARRARTVGAPVVADFHRDVPEVRRLLPFVDYAIVPEEFARATGRGDARDALRRLQRALCGGTPIVTQGARGGVYLDADGRVRRFASPRVRVRDTTGAGDAFHGAFCVGLLRGLPLERCLALAARAAGLACTELGARGRLLTAAEAGRLLEASRRPTGRAARRG